MILAKTDITKAFVPSTIINIDFYCFNACKKIKKLNLKSHLLYSQFAVMLFSVSTIEEFTIPSKVFQLKDNWYAFTPSLK